MQLKIYNSLTGEKEIFKPILEGNVGMYVCGPTVYSNVHMGNVRTFMSFDFIYRTLMHLGYKVRYVRNITDAGHLTDDGDVNNDRFVKQSRLEKLEPMEIVQKYTVDFHNVLKIFNNLPPNIEPTATGHIIEQLELTKKLVEKGLAYESNGSVYFDVHEYNKRGLNYGELSKRNIEELLLIPAIWTDKTKRKIRKILPFGKSIARAYYEMAIAVGRGLPRLAFGMHCNEH